MRYIDLFNAVISNSANEVPVLNIKAAENGVRIFKQEFKAGQVWVRLNRNGEINSAGVNWYLKRSK